MTEKERIKRKMVKIVRERQAELCDEMKRKFTDGIYINFDEEFGEMSGKIKELEVIKIRLWEYIK